MADKTEFLQAIDDAITDADSLEKFINGDDAQDVLTRLNAEYPTLQKAIKELFENVGIADRFKTLADLQTSPLVDGDYALVADDVSGKNGIYIKEGGAWVKSKYNFQSFIDLLLEQSNSDDMLDISVDDSGSVYRYTDLNAHLYLPDLPHQDSLQNNLKIIDDKSNTVKNNDNANLCEFVDDDNSVYAYFDNNADLVLSGAIKHKDAVYSNPKYLRHLSVLINNTPAVKALTPIAQKNEDNLIKRMPFAIKTKYGLVCFYHKQIAGFDGDETGSELWKAIINIDENLSITVVSRELFLAPDEPRGIVKHPTLGRTSDGRIILVFEKRLETSDIYTRYICYSSDEGLTFTSPKPLVYTNTPMAGQQVLGTTGVVFTANNGRLIIPMYIQTTAIVIYSDDDGVTWTWSYPASFVNLVGAHEPAIVKLPNGDLLLDVRPTATGRGRLKAVSKDNGITWRPYLTDTVNSAQNQGNILFDDSLAMLLQTHNNVVNEDRDHFTLSLSYDGGLTYPYSYQPFSNEWYGGYSQIIKWSEGIYLVVLEYADDFVGVNVNENAGILTLSITEMLNNVNYN